MTVRVSKSKFNLREKLSELDIPVGSHGSQVLKSADAAESFELVRAGRKNMIINGQCWINQRNGGSSVTIPNGTGGTYQLDRWAVNEDSSGTVSVNMDGDPPNQPLTGVGQFQKAMQIACSGTDTSMGSTENLHFFQNIEGYNMSHLQWGTVAAKDVTLSFWIKTNKAGTYCVGLQNNGRDRTCIKEYYQTGNSIWNKVVLTFPGCLSGTWLNTNDCGMRVRFCLASGSQYDDGVVDNWVNSDELTAGNQTNFMDSTNNRFFITGVQLEEGNVATPFEHRSYGEELSLCQRYFQQWSHGYVTCNSVGTSDLSMGIPLCVPLRAAPAVTGNGSSANLSLHRSGNVTSTCTVHSVSYTDLTSILCQVRITGMSGLTDENVYVAIPSGDTIEFSSEL